VADIFVSYTSSDRDWAFWIGQELLKLGHTPRIHEWEISAGGDISRWMEERHNSADYILCIVSEAYLKAPYSSWERRAAQWASATDRANFAVPVFVEICKTPTLLAPVKRCDLHGLSEDEARARLAAFLKPAAMPTEPVPFPGASKPATSGGVPAVRPTVAFPGAPDTKEASAVSNIPINIPRYFLGRDNDLAAIDAALRSDNGRVAITALHGLRGVGKTTLAAAYAEFHRDEYLATWWIRAETGSTLRADLVGLGVRLGWVAADAPEEPAVAVVLEQLREDGVGILLVYDNATSADDIRKYLPRGGAARIIATSNSPNWRGIAAPVEIEVWPKEIGADYLTARTGRNGEQKSALALSEALGGLPLAHEQAAAYCERLGMSLAEYRKRFEDAPGKLLDTEKDAPAEYHDRSTVARTFALAIDEAAKRHPAAEPLIAYAALLAPEPIPLFLFSEARERFGAPLASHLAGDGLDEAVAALLAFALIDRETIPDERDPSIATDCIRLHRLVREVAATRRAPEAARRVLIEAAAALYSSGVWRDPNTWPRARRLDPLALALVGGNAPLPAGVEEQAAHLLIFAAQYKQSALAAYAQARPLYERALAIFEKALGPDHLNTAISLNNLGTLLRAQGNLAGARPYYERALAICEKALGPHHPETATGLDNLGTLLKEQGDLAGARPYCERALAIRETLFGPEHLETALSLNNLGGLSQAQGDLAGARRYHERALAVREKALGPDHPYTALSLNNLGGLSQAQGNLEGARPHYERALAIREKALGPDHPETANSLNTLGCLLHAQGDLAGSRPYCERALAIREKTLGPNHPDTATSLNNLGYLLHAQGDLAGSRPYYERALAIREKTLGSNHPDTATSLNTLGYLLHAQGDIAGSRPYYERALAIRERTLGPNHPDTATSLNNLGYLLHAQGDLAGAGPYHERALAIREKALGPDHPETAGSLNHLGYLLHAQGDLAGARPYYERALAICEKTLDPDHPTTRIIRENLAALDAG
jgi:tetratricopeptide (TPR) repeat protein